MSIPIPKARPVLPQPSEPEALIHNIDDAVGYFAERLGLPPALLDILAQQRYEKKQFKELKNTQKIDFLSHLVASKSIAELNDFLDKYPPKQYRRA